jgi:hypothetical protein
MAVNTDFGFKDAISLYFERSNALQTYWNYQLTVILGLLGFFAATKFGSKARRLEGENCRRYCVVRFRGLRRGQSKRFTGCESRAIVPIC